MTLKFTARYSDEQLRRAWQSFLTHAELCDFLGCDGHTLRRAFQRLTLGHRKHIKRKHSHTHWIRAYQLRQQGLTYQQIADRLGVKLNRAWKYVHQYITVTEQAQHPPASQAASLGEATQSPEPADAWPSSSLTRLP